MKIYNMNIEYESGSGKTKTREVLTKVIKLEDVRKLIEEAYYDGAVDHCGIDRSVAGFYADEVIAGMEKSVTCNGCG